MAISLRCPQKNTFGQQPFELLTNTLPERMFSEVNQAVAMKHESQLLFSNLFLFVVFQRLSTNTVTVA